MQSVVAKNLAKSSGERNPNNKRGNILHTKKVGATEQSGGKRAQLLERFRSAGSLKK